MGRHDALISGSFAFQYFEKVLGKEPDLDIFIKQGAGAEAFCQYLSEGEGYALAKRQDKEDYAASDLIEAGSFKLSQDRASLIHLGPGRRSSQNYRAF